MAHRPIVIDRDGADGSAEGVGGVEPGPSNDHGGEGACIDQVDVPTAPPRPSARDNHMVRHRVENERRLPKRPQISALGLKTRHGVRKEGASPCFT